MTNAIKELHGRPHSGKKASSAQPSYRSYSSYSCSPHGREITHELIPPIPIDSFPL